MKAKQIRITEKSVIREVLALEKDGLAKVFRDKDGKVVSVGKTKLGQKVYDYMQRHNL